MKKLAVFAVSAAILGGAVSLPAHASPLPTGPVGAKCAFNSTTDVTAEAGNQIGEWRAGPLVVAEDGSLECQVVVNGVVKADISGSATAGLVVVIAPTPLHYPATAADDVVLCTTWHGASGTLYWHAGASATDLGFWDGNPGNCPGPTTIEPNDPECSIWKAIDRRAGTNIAEIWQDCEPYSEFPLPI